MSDNVLTTGIMEMGRQRNGAPFPAIEVIKWIYPEDWPNFTSELLQEIDRLEKQDRLRISNHVAQAGLNTERYGEVWIQVK